MLFVVVTFDAVSSSTIAELRAQRLTKHHEIPTIWGELEFLVVILTCRNKDCIIGEYFFSTDNSSAAIELVGGVLVISYLVNY